MSEDIKSSIAEAEELSRQMAQEAAALKKQTAMSAEELLQQLSDDAEKARDRAEKAADGIIEPLEEAATEVRDLIPEDPDKSAGERTLKFRTKKVTNATQPVDPEAYAEKQAQLAAENAARAEEQKAGEEQKTAEEEKPLRPEDDPRLIRLVKLEEAKITARNKSGGRRRGVGLISSILFVLAMLCAVYGGLVVFILGTGAWFNFIWLIGAGVLLILSFILSHHSRLPKFFKAVIVLLILACCVNFGVFLYRDIVFAADGPADNARWLIVLGAKVNGTEPSVEFKARLDKAAEYVRDADFERLRTKTASLPPPVTIVTTGGKGADEGAAEGDVAARVLIGLGFDESRILTENVSTTTLENFQNAKSIIMANGGTVFDDVVVVTSSFHLYRAIKLAKACGFNSVTGLGSTGLAVLLPHYYLREYAAIIKEVYLGHFGGAE